jgi:SPP1 gp7 family putative phage head morphogenesis protein
MIDTNSLVYNQAYDPTHTTVLRNTFVREMDRRFDSIVNVIKISVIDNDCFGLKDIQANVGTEVAAAGWQAFNYRLSQEKIAKFMEWLQIQVNNGILSVGEYEQIGTAVNSAWTNKYILDSYKRGVIRARIELQKAGYNVPSIESTGGVEMAVILPMHLDRIGLLYTRAYTDLKGITAQMDTYISRILAQGMADGDSPLLLARKMVATINGQGIGDLAMKDTLGRFISAKVRAETLARTEIIRAHHAATIQEYRNWAAFDVIVKAEVQTAGDDKVCPACDALAKGGPYSLDVAENMIPAHPNCRCCTLPVVIN